MSDITERIEYERSIEEQNAKLKDIAWMQSHMVRAPLANLMALIHLVADSSAEERPVIERMIQQASEELDQVIRNIVKNAERFERKEGATAITRYGLLGEELKELYLHPALLDLAPRAYTITNKHDQLIYANHAFERLSGYSFSELRGRRHSDIFIGEKTSQKTLAFMDQKENDRQPYEAEVYGYHKSGKPFWVRITAQPFISRQGTFSGYFYTKKDITNEKEAESTIIEKTEVLARINNELKNFTYTVSHDLKEPVNSLKALMNLLQVQAAEKLSKEELEFIERAISSVDRISSMVKALLEYSRSSSLNESLAIVSVQGMVEEVKQALQNIMEDSQAVVEFTGEDVEMEVYPLQCSRILQNLIQNSLKFKAENRIPEISITCNATSTHWIISVSDNGIGIALDDQEQVFDLFYHKSEISHVDSHGIGLAVVKRFV